MEDVRSDFWSWVGGRNAGDNPRGDFIRDTKSLLDAGINPDTRLDRAVERAEEEHDLLWRRYAKENNLAQAVLERYLLIHQEVDDQDETND